MKRCPECRRDYFDDSLLYCLDDGRELLEGPAFQASSIVEPATAILDDIGVEARTRRLVSPAEDIAGSQDLPDRRRGSRRVTVRRVMPFAVVVAILVAGSVYLGTRYYGSHSIPEQIRSIAVMPFVNDTGSPDLEYLSDGITETLISNLARSSTLKVQSRNAVFRYKDQTYNAGKVGRELGIQAIVTGRVARRGNDLSFYVELTDAATDKALWSQTYTRSSAELVGLERQISLDTTSRLAARLASIESQGSGSGETQNSEAYRLYLQGRYHFNKYTQKDFLKGIEYFNQAIELDPNYALPYSGLADTYVDLGNDYLPPKNAFPLAKTYALQSIERGPQLAEAHAALGAVAFFYDWDWEAARTELEHVIELSPESVEPYACTLHYSDAVGSPENAVGEIRRVHDQHPTSIVIDAEIGCSSYYAGLFDQAISESQRTIEADSSFAPAYYNLGRALAQKQRYPEAIKALMKARELLDGNNHAVAELGYVYAMSGKADKGRAALQELDQIASTRYVDHYLRAVVLIGLGDKGKALDQLEQAFNEHSSWMPWLRVEAKFDSLRTEPRFQALMHRMNFGEAPL